jgi:hypothetical protein
MSAVSKWPRIFGGLLLMETLALAACGATANEAGGQTGPCTASEVEGVVVYGGAAAGHTDEPVLLRDRGSSPCRLEGYADVRVVDASGTTLAQATGGTGRGTFFGDRPSAPVVLAPRTPILHPGAAPDRFGAQGQAWMNLEWVDCQHRSGSRLLVDLPGGGGRLSLAPPPPAASPACEVSGHSADSSLVRGPVTASG